MQINIYGPYFAGDGYSSHVKGLSNALDKLEGIDICIRTQLPPQWLRLVNDEELKMVNRDSNKGDINLMVGVPRFWPLLMCEDKPFIGFCVWEGDKVPESWIDILLDERAEQIWVPSEHTKKAIMETAYLDKRTSYSQDLKDTGIYKIILDKIKIVPHGVDLSIFKPTETKHDKFTFIMNGGWPNSWRDRKGLSYGIKAFSEEFSKDENVKMLVKVNSVYGFDLNKNIKDLDVQNQNKPEVRIVFEQVDFKDLVKIYNEGDVFVNTSLADGFCLPCLEAQACGLPVITTTFGGMSDFCNEETGWLLKEGEMKENNGDINYEGISWKYPNVDEIKKAMRYCYEHQEEVKEKGIKSLENSKKFTWEQSAKKAKELIITPRLI